MKKRIFSIFAALVVFLLYAVCIHRISKLENTVNGLQNTLNANMNDISRSISHIYNNIDSKLEEKANLLSSYDSAYGRINIENKTVLLEYSVVPKEYNPDTTTAALICNDAEYPMQLENGKFITQIALPIFEYSSVTAVKLIDNGIIHTQALRSDFMPYHEVISELNTGHDGRRIISKKDNAYVVTYNGQLEINFNQAKFGSYGEIAEEIYLIERIDGKTIAKTNVPKSTKPSALHNDYGSYATEVETSAGAIMVNEENDCAHENITYYYPMEHEVSIPAGSTYELYIVVTDSLGLRHVQLLEKIVTDINGNSPQSADLYSTAAAIYDASDNLLYSPDDLYGMPFDFSDVLKG